MRSGVATIVFTDVEGSTALTRAVGDERAQELIELQRLIIRDQIDAFGGREIDTAGDGFLIVFDSVRAALGFARTAQDELVERAEGVRVRIGAHAGEVLAPNEQPFGNAVNGAARVAAQARGGQVLVSEAVRQLAGDVPGLRLREKGRTRLKGFDEPWRLYELDWDGRKALRPQAQLPERTRKHRGLLAVTAIAIAAVAIAAVLLGRHGAAPTLAGPDSVSVFDPSTRRVVGVVAVGRAPRAMTVDERSLWVGSFADATLIQIDLRSRQAVRTWGVDPAPMGVAVWNGLVWTARRPEFIGQTNVVKGFDPAAGGVLETQFVLPTANQFSDTVAPLVAGGSDLWAGSSFDLERLPRGASKWKLVTDSLADAAESMLYANRRVWIGTVGGSLVRYSPTTSDAAAVTIEAARPALVSGLAATPDAVWASVRDQAEVVRVDTQFATVRDRIHLSSDPLAIASGDGAVWTGNIDGTITRIDPERATVVTTTKIARGPISNLVYANHLLWASVQAP